MKARREAQAQQAALTAQQQAILRSEEERARNERISAIRDRVVQRNASFLRSYGVRGGTAPSAPTATSGLGGGLLSWLLGGWRSASLQGTSFLRFPQAR